MRKTPHVIIDATNYLNSNPGGCVLLDYVNQELCQFAGEVKCDWVVDENGKLFSYNWNTLMKGDAYDLSAKYTDSIYIDFDPLLSDSAHRQRLYAKLHDTGLKIITVLGNKSVEVLIRQRVQTTKSEDKGHESLLHFLLNNADVIVLTSRWAERTIGSYYTDKSVQAATTVIRPDYVLLHDISRIQEDERDHSGDSSLYVRAKDWARRRIVEKSASKDGLSDIENMRLAELQQTSVPFILQNEIEAEISGGSFETSDYFQVTKQEISFSERLFSLAEKLYKKPIKHAKVLQHVIISIRPDELKYCINKTDRLSSFVKKYTVITQPSRVAEFAKILRSKHPIEVLNEADILGSRYEEFLRLDHARKNLLLRSELMKSAIVDDEFIMLDDDNVPIIAINRDYFIEPRTGKYRAYYFEELYKWGRRNTSYDLAQEGNLRLLRKMNAELLMYSSHMPQIINKTIFLEMLNAFDVENAQYALDEWSTYFNYATSHYPALFIKKHYQVCGWPAHPNDWMPTYEPRKFAYHNRYPELDAGKDDIEIVNRYLEYSSHFRSCAFLDAIVKKRYRPLSIEKTVKYEQNNYDMTIYGIRKLYAAQPDTIMWHDVIIKVSSVDNTKEQTVSLLCQSAHETVKYPLSIGYNSVKIPVHIADYGARSYDLYVDIEGKRELLYSAIAYGSSSDLIEKELKLVEETYHE